MHKIEELTSKLYNEGIEKGNIEADKIISDAKELSYKMIKDAEDKAQKIISEANSRVAVINKQFEIDLKQAYTNSVDLLRTTITNLISSNIATHNVKSAFESAEFTQKLILELAQNWAKDQKIIISVAESDSVKEYIEDALENTLENSFKIEYVNNIKTGFVITPENGNYKVKFGEEEFIAYFKEFLRPNIKKLLF